MSAVHVKDVVVACSRGEARRWHNVWDGDAVCSVQERQQNVATNHLKLVSQNQRQTRRHQQHPVAKHPVCMLSDHWRRLTACLSVESVPFCMVAVNVLHIWCENLPFRKFLCWPMVVTFVMNMHLGAYSLYVFQVAEKCNFGQRLQVRGFSDTQNTLQTGSLSLLLWSQCYSKGINSHKSCPCSVDYTNTSLGALLACNSTWCNSAEVGWLNE